MRALLLAALLPLAAAPLVSQQGRPGRGQAAALDRTHLITAGPELVLVGGKVVTLDPERPEAEAIAMQDGHVLAVGSRAQIEALVTDDTQVVDLQGALAIPGFIEGHGHFLGVGDAKLQLDLMQATSWDEIVGMVAKAVEEAEPGELIRGRGWHQSKWTVAPEPSVEGLPTHHALSAVSPENPVLLTHASGHAVFANARAMELCGVTAETPDPEGGTVVRDAEGQPIGAFRETASALLGRLRFTRRPRDMSRPAEYAVAECLSKGITSFQDAGSSFGDVELYKRMADGGRLGVRLWVMLREPVERLERRLAEGYRVHRHGDHRLTVGGVKRSIDGALGPHGAWLLEPYADMAESAGLNTTPVEDVEACAVLCARNDLQLCVHAIGDRANREVLDIYEAAFAEHGRGAERRWRIEHAQHLHPDDIPRFAELGVVAAMQGVHCTSDAPWVMARLGAERAAAGAYVWRALLDSGAVIANGTDAPVEDVDPLASFYASVSRRLPDGTPWYPEQCMTREEALRSYTLDAAWAAFEEDIKGSLEPGKLGDVTVLSKDILTCPVEEIREARVLYTIVGGAVAYAAEGTR